MQIHTITAAMLDQFTSLTPNPERAANFGRMVQGMWESGEGRPEWCFVAAVDGDVVGRVGFFKHDGSSEHLAMFGWHLPWAQDNYATLGAIFLHGCVEQLKTQNIFSIRRELNSHWGTVDQQAAVLTAAGFENHQTQHVYEYFVERGRVEQSSRLTLKTVGEVGDTAFMDVIAQCMADSPDQTIQALIAEHGIQEFIKLDFNFLRNDHDVEDAWWCVAYSADNKLVGFFQSVRFPNTPTGNAANLGIVPTQRGKRYSGELLAAATNVLLEANVESIIGRTDGLNRPMQRTFEKIGYQLDSKVTTYRLVL